jgi:two-component system NtrC family sensor kinase
MVVYHGTWAAFLFYCLALLVYLGGYISGRLRLSERDLEERNRQLQETLSSLRAAYDRLARTEAHLVHSEKMRSLGQLVAGVAHELNNPISFVSGNVEHLRTYIDRLRQALDAYAQATVPAAERTNLEQLRRDLRVDEALADLPILLDDCEEGARRTKRIVNELRVFSRSDERESFQRSDIHRGIESTLALLADRMRDHITVHRNFGDLPEVDCLPGQLNQVLMNLLVNAADAIGGRPGNIWIDTRLVDVAPYVSEQAPQVTIAVRDDGSGMGPEIQAKVFEPFFTTKQAGEGTGLGLTVSYGIIARHHGTLTVESALGVGTLCTITLPLRQQAAQG